MIVMMIIIIIVTLHEFCLFNEEIFGIPAF
jgi:hypothetical protein